MLTRVATSFCSGRLLSPPGARPRPPASACAAWPDSSCGKRNDVAIGKKRGRTGRAQPRAAKVRMVSQGLRRPLEEGDIRWGHRGSSAASQGTLGVSGERHQEGQPAQVSCPQGALCRENPPGTRLQAASGGPVGREGPDPVGRTDPPEGVSERVRVAAKRSSLVSGERVLWMPCAAVYPAGVPVSLLCAGGVLALFRGPTLAHVLG